MHNPGATQACFKHHQNPCAKSQGFSAVRRYRHITFQQEAGLLLVVGPGEAADTAALDRPGLHLPLLQLIGARVAGHGARGRHS